MILDLDWPEMRNKLLIIYFLCSEQGFTQIIEAESRPNRYDIDRYNQTEGKSKKYSFEMESIFKSIESKIDKEMKDWLQNQNNLSSTSIESVDLKNAKYLEIRHKVVQEVGQNSFNSRTPNFLFHPDKLLFEIILDDFKSFFIEVSSSEIEDFKINFNKLQYTNQQYLYNDEKKFVLTSVTLFNPGTNNTYHYTDANVNNYSWYPFIVD